MLLRIALLACGLAAFMAGCGDGFEATQSSTNTNGGGGAGASGGTTAHGGTGGTTSHGGTGGTPTTSTSSSGGTGGGEVDPIVIVQATPTAISLLADAVPALTWQTPPAPGNTVIVGITCFSDIDNCIIPAGGVTDDHGNTYQLAMEGDTIISQPTHGSRGYLFIAENIASGDTFTISADPNGTVPPQVQELIWGAIEVSGLVPNSLDQTGLFPNTGGMIFSTTVETASVTAQGNELAVAVHTMRSSDADVAYTHDPDWTEQHVQPDGVAFISAHSMVTLILAEPDVVSHTWTHDEPTRGVAAIIATFRGN